MSFKKTIFVAVLTAGMSVAAQAGTQSSVNREELKASLVSEFARRAYEREMQRLHIESIASGLFSEAIKNKVIPSPEVCEQQGLSMDALSQCRSSLARISQAYRAENCFRTDAYHRCILDNAKHMSSPHSVRAIEMSCIALHPETCNFK